MVTQPFPPMHDCLPLIATRANSLADILPIIRMRLANAPTTELTATEQQEVDRRLGFWCQHGFKGDWDRFQQRLALDGLTPAIVQHILLEGDRIQLDKIPSWTVTLQTIMEAAPEFLDNPHSDLVHLSEPVPFQDLCLPAVLVAQHRIKDQFSEFEPLLSSAAWHMVYQQLLAAVVQVMAPTLMYLFTERRSGGSPLKHFLQAYLPTTTETQLYKAFVKEYLADGFQSLFIQYSALGRLLATIIEMWIETTGELLTRLHQDWSTLEQQFSPHQSLDQVVALQSQLSDSHNQGRTVAILTFANGLKLVYKPKNMGLAVAFNHWLAWFNQQTSHLDLKYPVILDRINYGWVEFVEQHPCDSEAALDRFYHRYGMLLCLVDVLEGNDFHYENILASGEYPVLVDLETLLVPRLGRDAVDPANSQQALAQRLANSVLRTHMLPRPVSILNQSSQVVDVSALGHGSGLTTKLTWHHVNTDTMKVVTESVPSTQRSTSHLPHLGGIPSSPEPFIPIITGGYVRMYESLMEYRDQILSSTSPIWLFVGQISRVVFRDTVVYFHLLGKACSPHYLETGVIRSLSFEVLERTLAHQVHRDLILAEKQALERSDIPMFSSKSNSRDLYCNETVLISDFFTCPSLDVVLARLRGLSQTDLAFQTQVIQLSLYARYQQEPQLTSSVRVSTAMCLSPSELDLDPERSIRLIDTAVAIGMSLQQIAIWDADGQGAAWLNISCAHDSQHFHVASDDVSLYSGSGGIGLFFAALACVTEDNQWRQMALAAVHSIRQALRQESGNDWHQVLNHSEGGVAHRFQSLIYVFTRMGDLLQDASLLADAYRVTTFLTVKQITSDRHFDLFRGTAGRLMSLLSVLPYQTGREKDRLLGLAIACGDHLLANQTGSKQKHGPQAWITWHDRCLTGYSQGAAGIAAALLKLFNLVPDHRFLAAAKEGIDYEQTQFCETANNWLDLRRGEPAYQVSWAHGAAGIALGRLSTLAILDTEAIRQHIAIALDTTKNALVWGVDSLGWGTLGRVETLLAAAQILGRDDLLLSAYQAAEQVLNHSTENKSFTLFQHFSMNGCYPGFLHGHAGIGYELLRLACPHTLPSVLSWG